MAVPTQPSLPLSAMSDEQIAGRLKALAIGDRQVLVSFIRHLDEFDRRRIYAPLGFPSLFQYCRQELRLSEDQACHRILVARLYQKFPQVLDALASGALALSNLARLSAHINEENVDRLLAEARGLGRREIDKLISEFAVEAPKRDEIRYLPPRVEAPSAPPIDAPLLALMAPKAEPQPAPSSPAPEAAKGELDPSPARPSPPKLVRISFTASEELAGKIEQARSLLRGKISTGRLEEVFDRALDALLSLHDPARRSARKTEPRVRSRRIPKWVRDEVWRRDGGQCAFIASDGRRCGESNRLEFDHVVPYALGEASDEPAGIRLLWRTHNQLAAERVFGERGEYGSKENREED